MADRRQPLEVEEHPAEAVLHAVDVRRQLHGRRGRFKGCFVEHASIEEALGPAVQIADRGISTGASKDAARAQMLGEEVNMRVDLGLGSAAATAWGCDLTEGYVVENSSYST